MTSGRKKCCFAEGLILSFLNLRHFPLKKLPQIFNVFLIGCCKEAMRRLEHHFFYFAANLRFLRQWSQRHACFNNRTTHQMGICFGILEISSPPPMLGSGKRRRRMDVGYPCDLTRQNGRTEEDTAAAAMQYGKYIKHYSRETSALISYKHRPPNYWLVACFLRLVD